MRPYSHHALLLTALLSAAAGAEEKDVFLLGYAAAVCERELAIGNAELAVEGGALYLRAGPLEPERRADIERALAGIPGVAAVHLLEGPESGEPRSWHAVAAPNEPEEPADPNELRLFPRDDLFDPLLADPRWPHFSAAVQSYGGDDELSGVAAVSFGETIPLLGGPAFAEGRFEVALHAAVFSIFDLDSESFDLLNSDFLVGLAATWRRGDLSLLGRVYHQSSHLGDELLLRSRIERVNLSFETLELLASRDLGEVFRVYGGASYLVHRNPSDLEPWHWQLGLEARSPRSWLGGALRPIGGIDLQSREETDWDIDVSIRAGVQLQSPGVLSQHLQIMLEYYDGHSPNGQFFERAIRYWGLGAHVYF